MVQLEYCVRYRRPIPTKKERTRTRDREAEEEIEKERERESSPTSTRARGRRYTDTAVRISGRVSRPAAAAATSTHAGSMAGRQRTRFRAVSLDFRANHPVELFVLPRFSAQCCWRGCVDDRHFVLGSSASGIAFCRDNQPVDSVRIAAFVSSFSRLHPRF